MERRETHHGVVGPIIVVGIGVLLLLSNLGMLQWSVWEALAKLWPVLLIGAGLDLAIGRRSALGSLIVAVLMLAVLAGAVFLMTAPAAAGQEVTGDRLSQPLQGASSAQVDMRIGAARVRVGGSAPAGQLLEGTARVGQTERVVTDARVANDSLIYTASSQGVGVSMVGFNRDRVWDLRLTGSVPVNLALSLGAGEAILDLREAKVTRLDLSIGAGAATITIPAGASLAANLKVAVGDMQVRVPRGAALRVDGQGAVAVVSLPGGRDSFGHTTYTSAGYQSAAERIDLTVSCAVGAVRIVEY